MGTESTEWFSHSFLILDIQHIENTPYLEAVSPKMNKKLLVVLLLLKRWRGSLVYPGTDVFVASEKQMAPLPALQSCDCEAGRVVSSCNSWLHLSHKP